MTGYLRLRVTAVRPPVVARIDREVEITRLPTAPPQGERRATRGREADLVARCCCEPFPESLEGLRQRALRPVGGHTVRDPFRRVVGLVHSRCPMSRSMSPGVGSRYRWSAASDVPDRVRHGGLDEVVTGSSGPSALQMFPAPAWGEEVSARMIFLPPPWSVEVMRCHLRCTVRWSREVFPRSALWCRISLHSWRSPGGLADTGAGGSPCPGSGEAVFRMRLVYRAPPSAPLAAFPVGRPAGSGVVRAGGDR